MKRILLLTLVLITYSCKSTKTIYCDAYGHTNKVKKQVNRHF